MMELVIVVLIRGLVAKVTAPLIGDVSTDAEIVAIKRHVAMGHTAAQAYYGENGRFPRDDRQGRRPKDFEGFLPKSNFTMEAPRGGVWDWNGEGRWGGVCAGMQIDKELDDGNLKTGYITLYRNRTLQFLLEPIPDKG